MKISEFSDDELSIFAECLRAAGQGPFFEDAEFFTLFGMERSDLTHIRDNWSTIDKDSPNVRRAVISSLNLLTWFHATHSAWSSYISVAPENLEKLLERVEPERP